MVEDKETYFYLLLFRGLSISGMQILRSFLFYFIFCRFFLTCRICKGTSFMRCFAGMARQSQLETLFFFFAPFSFPVGEFFLLGITINAFSSSQCTVNPVPFSMWNMVQQFHITASPRQ